MATRILTVFLRVLLLAALVASVVLFVDYASAANPAFCGEGGGCAKVRDSGFTHIGPVSLPALGIGTFAGLFTMSVFASRERHLRLLFFQTVLVALGALALIGLQVVKIGAVCPWCMVVDVSALLAAGVAFALYRRGEDVESMPMRLVWVTVGIVAAGVPMLWDYTASAQVVGVPKPLQKYQEEGKVNLVMFTDFECPHCRRLHAAVEDLRPGLGDKLNLVRKMNPLAGHPGAGPAARGYLCMPEDKRDEAANMFYTAEPGRLTPSDIVATAVKLGVDPTPFGLCLADPKTDKQIEYDKKIFKDAGLNGVPTSFVNDEIVRGADIAAMKSALSRARGGDGGGSDVLWMFVFIALVVGGASIASIRAAMDAEEE